MVVVFTAKEAFVPAGAIGAHLVARVVRMIPGSPMAVFNHGLRAKFTFRSQSGKQARLDRQRQENQEERAHGANGAV